MKLSSVRFFRPRYHALYWRSVPSLNLSENPDEAQAPLTRSILQRIGLAKHPIPSGLRIL
jgi:hypothetical protein